MGGHEEGVHGPEILKVTAYEILPLLHQHH